MFATVFQEMGSVLLTAYADSYPGFCSPQPRDMLCTYGSIHSEALLRCGNTKWHRCCRPCRASEAWGAKQPNGDERSRDGEA